MQGHLRHLWQLQTSFFCSSSMPQSQHKAFFSRNHISCFLWIFQEQESWVVTFLSLWGHHLHSQVKRSDSVSGAKSPVEHSGVSRINQCTSNLPSKGGHISSLCLGTSKPDLHTKPQWRPQPDPTRSMPRRYHAVTLALQWHPAPEPWEPYLVWAVPQDCGHITEQLSTEPCCFQSALTTQCMSILWGYMGVFSWKCGWMGRCLLMTSQTGGIDIS